MCLQTIYSTYMYKEDLVLNNQQWLMCHKTQPNPTQPNPTQLIFCIAIYSYIWLQTSIAAGVDNK